MTQNTPTDPQEDTASQAEHDRRVQLCHESPDFMLNGPKIDLVSAALVVAQGAIKPAEFDATNPFFKSKYATLGSVIAASREALCQSGLAILQVPTIQGDLVSVHTRIVHKSGQSLDCGVMSLSLGESDRNSDAQLAGSIITYLKRYAWSSILGIYADTDDDGNSGPKGAIPRQQPAKTPTLGSATPPDDQKKLEDWNKYRMKLLNKLEAAAGQRNRVLLTDYLTSCGHLKTDQVLEDWPFKLLPSNKEQESDLIAAMQTFDMKRAQSDLAEEMK